ncbi:CheY-like superfamily [Penicillium sp. DV-2018c]|nr:CheY-like superfamily [Penicillium sp. DV-2018c]KAJ5583453.1 CheY-like superfamily [Penicillium sp. DV-2018c]
MSSPSNMEDHGDWKVFYDEPNDDDHNTKKEKKLSDRRRTLARTLSIPKSMCILSDNKTQVSTVTELVSPRLQLPQLGTDSSERVFPVRSAVSLDSMPSSALQTPSFDRLETQTPPFPDMWTTWPAGEPPDFQQKDPPNNKDNPEKEDLARPDYLARLHYGSRGGSEVSTVPKHETTASLNPNPAILAQLQNTVQNGGEILGFHDLEKGSRETEDEFLIQSSGALIVITETEGRLEVRVASSNCQEILGRSPDELFALETFCDILPMAFRSCFLARAEFVMGEDYTVEHFGPEVFLLSVLSSNGDVQSVWCTMHTNDLHKGYFICEFQPEVRETESKADAEDSEDETTTSSKRTLDMTSGAFFEHEGRSKKQSEPRAKNMLGQAGNQTLDMAFGACNEHGSPPSKTSGRCKGSVPDSAELLNSVPRILRQLASAQTLEVLFKHTINTLRDLIRFHRTTIYHFDSDHNGVVVADEIDPSSGSTSYENLKFPEATFPESLKRAYTRNTVSFSCSGNQGAAKLVIRPSADYTPLDLSNTYLSSPLGLSTTHTDNPVEACLSIQIMVFGKLWGLISCQSYKGSQTLHPLIQKVCWVIVGAVSNNIERLSYTLPFQLRETEIPVTKASASLITETPPGNLLSLFRADYAAASIMGESRVLGNLTDSQEALALVEYMKAKENDTVFWSTNIAADFEDLNYSRGFHHLSSLLHVPLSVDGHDFIIFFKATSEDPGITSDLERTSDQWTSSDIGKASVLSLLYHTFTNIWQEKETTLQNNQLMRLLLANSAHEFRTPLNAIINYLEIALDSESLDQDTRDHISRSHSASKSLVYIINDLLDHTNAENGQCLIKDEAFNLSETLSEATDIFWEEARQKHVDLQVVQHAILPLVPGDQRRVRQVITNLISNAIQHTSTGAVTIESCVIPGMLLPGHISVEVAIHDTGCGMSQETVETLFCELEQVSNKGSMRPPKSYEQSTTGQAVETRSVLGLGLALVARIVRNMNGQLSLKSEEGKGSCFKIRLEFPLPNEESSQTQDAGTASKEDESKQELKHELGSTNCTGNEREDTISCECGQTSEFAPGQSTTDIDISLRPSQTANSPPHPSDQHPELKQSDESTSPPSTIQHPKASPENQRTAEPNVPPGMDWNLHVLVAEDDPVNSTILQKRLVKFGHTVHMTTNGKECAAAYKTDPTRFDAILMDLQMPIVDGLAATKMIREYEQNELASETGSPPRIPIFAVSASLLEENRRVYMDSGFDGWVMKPIDFQRVDRLLGGVRLQWVRKEAVYQDGMWEEGGWFEA